MGNSVLEDFSPNYHLLLCNPVPPRLCMFDRYEGQAPDMRPAVRLQVLIQLTDQLPIIPWFAHSIRDPSELDPAAVAGTVAGVLANYLPDLRTG